MDKPANCVTQQVLSFKTSGVIVTVTVFVLALTQALPRPSAAHFKTGPTVHTSLLWLQGMVSK
jgi:hypothetical protein